jgi:hypothetical protein
MITVSKVQTLIKSISVHSNFLPKSVPNGTTQDKIWTVMHSPQGETGFETFNQRFDALFGKDCHDSDGHLQHIRQGKYGMKHVCTYLSNIKWMNEFLLNLVENKLVRLNTELAHLRYACLCIDLYTLY